MNIKELQLNFSICKLSEPLSLDLSQEFVFFSKTNDEFSLVYEERFGPKDALTVAHD